MFWKTASSAKIREESEATRYSALLERCFQGTNEDDTERTIIAIIGASSA